MTQDELYMRRCIELAQNGRQLARPNPMVGAVITAPSPFGEGSGEATLDPQPSTLNHIIGEGYHVRCGEGHAEVNAFASVRPGDEPLLKDATIYVSLEPCAHYGKTPPCCDLIIKKGVKRVVVGCVDPFSKVQGRGIERMREAGIEVTVGVLEKECRNLNRRFFTFHEKHRPYIILKWAQTENGFLDDNGQSLAISSPYTKMLVHQLRAEEDAIVVGHTTWEREHPQLNVREWSGSSPVRYILTREQMNDGVSCATPLCGAENSVPSCIPDIHSLLADCYERQLQSLIVEGGAKTLESFLAAGLWDEIRVETNTALRVEGGTKAPQLPAEATVYSKEQFDGNVITSYQNQQVSHPISAFPIL